MLKLGYFFKILLTTPPYFCFPAATKPLVNLTASNFVGSIAV